MKEETYKIQQERKRLVGLSIDKPVRTLIQIDTWQGLGYLSACPNDKDGDALFFSAVPALQRGDYPVRILIHPSATLEDVQRILGKITSRLPENWEELRGEAKKKQAELEAEPMW